jgi:CRISPR/Cas system-associated exonuclease Cas4 (RecB family)
LSVESDYSKVIDLVLDTREIQVRLGGKIDRVDQIDDAVRVIDYKTGNANQTFPGISELFDSGLRSRNGAAFQTLFYAWLVKEAYPMSPVTPGLYVMRKLYEDHFDPALIMGSRQQQKRISAFSDVETDFVDHLREVIAQIFDPETPFVQTEIESRCRICDFAAICNRKFIE